MTVGSFSALCGSLVRLHPSRHAAECAKSLSNEDVNAVSAYIQNLNGLVGADTTRDAKSLAAIKMPDRDRFVRDARPDVK